ncbi:MAG: HD domain-containing phosphohydrolase [Bacillota bacterium]
MNAISKGSVRVLLVGETNASPAIAELLKDLRWLSGSVSTTPEALRFLRNNPGVDLVLIVPQGSPEAFSELCRSIKFDARTSFIPVIFMVPMRESSKAHELFEAGADDCIAQTASDAETMIRLRRAIHFKQATDSLEDAQTVITSLANAIEGKDAYTCGHVERVGAYSVQIGRRVGVDEDGLAALQTGGLVHDIGKVGIPDPILNKQGKLTEEEFAIMKRHPVIGYDILKPMRTFHAVLPIVRWHHEKPNGTGYPDGLKGDELPLLSRITAVADCFDALSTDRPYRPAMPLAKCRAILEEGGEKGDLDPLLVATLFAILDEGMQLNTGIRAA